jgi:hypothetical protein
VKMHRDVHHIDVELRTWPARKLFVLRAYDSRWVSRAAGRVTAVEEP